MATLTRAEMEAIITSGASVSIGGRVIHRIADLPSEADLARGDATKEAAVSADLQQQIAALTAQLNSITQAQPSAEPSGETSKTRPTGKKD